MDEDLSIHPENKVTFRDYTRKVDTDANPDESGYLDFDGYLKLMVAQMSNQDFNDPMSDSEFISQMANYSMMETISKMNEQSQISYAASLVGKAVTVDNGGTSDTGVVETVIIDDGKYQLLINGEKYDSSSVTDIVDASTYNTLVKVIGMNATATDDEGRSVTGEITNIVIRKGQGYVIIDGKPYKFESTSIGDSTDQNSDTKVDTESGKDENGNDKVENEEGKNDTSAEAAEETAAQNTAPNNAQNESAEQTESSTRSASVDPSGAAMGLTDDSAEVYENVAERLSEFYDENRQYLGKRNYEDADGYSGITDGSSSLGAYADIFDDGEENGSYIDTVDEVSAMSASAKAARSRARELDNGYYATEVEDVASSFSGINNHSDEEGVTTKVEGSDARSSFAEESDIFENSSSAEKSDAASNSRTYYNMPEGGNIDTSGYTSSMNSSRDPYLFVEDPGVAYGVTVGSNKAYDVWPPEVRAFQNYYPAEASLANSLGTKMYDIRFIHNSDITSVINTDKVLGYTITGRAFTDIGFSGQGKLGEIVTWSDGTQRVEIIGKKGSSWYTTSGNYTIDEICDTSGNFAATDLTPFEQVIRAASREYSPDERRYLNEFGQYGAAAAKRALSDSGESW